jgi:hypothetical protein
MNYSLAVLLLNDNCRAIKAIYDTDKPDVGVTAKRELFKTFDETVAVGDIVMVPSGTRHNVTAVKVVETDVEWDVHTSGDVKWIIGKVDQREFTKLKEMEEQAISAIKESEKTAARKKMRTEMLQHMDEAAIKQIDLANVGPGRLIEQKAG